jgi:uncharacterized secreted repeat protein (TIGR03808 family)
MNNQRRYFLRLASLGAGAAALGTASGTRPALAAPQPVVTAGLDAAPHVGSLEDQTEYLQRAINQAASTRTPVALRPTTYRASGLELPPGVEINGITGATRIVANRARPIFTSAHAGEVRISGITFDGGGQSLPQGAGLVTLADGERVRVADCEFIGAAGFGLALDGIGGEVTGNTVTGASDAGIFSINARGMTIARNRIRRAGNNGIQVWRSERGEDGSIVADNIIEQIDSRDGGTGQNGNGVNVFRANNVTVRGNRISDCVFSAVRGNGASNIRILDNTCKDLGEVALYAEFSFEGAIIANNTVDGAGHGVSVTNFNEGGRLAVVQGNIFRNLAPQARARIENKDHGVGIYVEADTAVTGNVVENAARAGIEAGWGRYLRDVTITGNVVRQSAVGVAVSVVTGAGAALIANNLISGAAHGAIVGMDHSTPVTGDLAKEGTTRYSQLVISGNRVN